MPNVYVFGGPNGAGKTTLALKLLPALGVRHFVNADSIAAGLSPLDVSVAQFAAGRLMRQRLKELVENEEDFGFETTFASNAATKFLVARAREGWNTQFVFVWLPNAEMAIERVATRVRAGGHFVAEHIVRRRYCAGLQRLQKYVATENDWTVYDNSGESYRIVAQQREKQKKIFHEVVWREILK